MRSYQKGGQYHKCPEVMSQPGARHSVSTTECYHQLNELVRANISEFRQLNGTGRGHGFLGDVAAADVCLHCMHRRNCTFSASAVGPSLCLSRPTTTPPFPCRSMRYLCTALLHEGRTLCSERDQGVRHAAHSFDVRLPLRSNCHNRLAELMNDHNLTASPIPIRDIRMTKCNAFNDVRLRCYKEPQRVSPSQTSADSPLLDCQDGKLPQPRCIPRG